MQDEWGRERERVRGCRTLYRVKKKEPTSHLTRPADLILLVVHVPLGIDDRNYEILISELHFS